MPGVRAAWAKLGASCSQNGANDGLRAGQVKDCADLIGNHYATVTWLWTTCHETSAPDDEDPLPRVTVSQTVGVLEEGQALGRSRLTKERPVLERVWAGHVDLIEIGRNRRKGGSNCELDGYPASSRRVAATTENKAERRRQ